jgi:transcriptional regulator with XRE-family HTH domain
MTKETIFIKFGIELEKSARCRYFPRGACFRAGIHRTYLGGIERGERNPSLKNIDILAKALNIDIAKLFT